ncbi:MAG UNVERIFIED_CONTAM: hypothetical protein LVR18_14435 [Planctomycetaceae bacterium]
MTPSRLLLDTVANLQLFGLVRSLDANSDVILAADGQVLIDGLVVAADQLSISGGSHSSDYGIVILPIIIDPATEERVSGGEIRTGRGGRIFLESLDGILIQGTVGSFQLDGDTVAADSQSVSAVSTNGAVSIEGRIDSAQAITLTGKTVNVLAGGRLRTSSNTATTRISAADLVFVEAATGTGDAQLAPGSIQTAGLLHLLGKLVAVDGMLQSSSDRVLLNAVESLEITGTVTACAEYRT